MTFYLHQVNRFPCPFQANNKAAARKQLREIVREEVAMCRRRFGTAVAHRIGPDTYQVTFGRSRNQSPLWTTLFITT